MKKNHSHACVTDCGVPGVGSIPLNFHFCNFYQGRKDLVDSLVPYFAAGIKNNERCIWVCAEPLRAVDAIRELSKVVNELDSKIVNGDIQILDAESWYLKVGTADIPKYWLFEEERALADGFQGIRIAGNTSFVTPETWQDFMDYEKVVGKLFEGRQITAFCNYSLDQCGASGVLEVANLHQAALERNHSEPWALLT